MSRTPVIQNRLLIEFLFEEGRWNLFENDCKI